MKPLAVIGALALLSQLACGTHEAAEAPAQAVEVAPAAPEPWSDAWLQAEGQRYLHDAAFRRQALEASLTNPKNIYSIARLTGYGVPGRGWDLLPEWTPKTRVIDDAYVADLRAGAPVALEERPQALWDGREPENMSEWVALGRKVFFQYPLRSEVFAEHALRSAEISARIGLEPDSRGEWAGVVAFETLDGGTEIGITCALCHVSVENGTMVEGRARRSFDYGEMRLAFYRDTGAFLADDIKRRMATWGPGRADITQDDDEDPVAIVDLWGVRHHAYLTQSGTLRHGHPAALAIRQETQILHANHERVRPPRELAWALAMYLYSLSPPPRPDVAASGIVDRGHELFSEHCSHCHRDESFGGLPISADEVGTDPALARGRARGTGLYRPSPLIRVAEAAPYLHDGTVATLAELFDEARVVPGHRYGVSLPSDDREALVAFLRTL